MSIFSECKREIQNLTQEIKEVHNKTFRLMEKILDLNFLSFEGLEIKTELENINRKLKQLILRIKYKAEELEMLSKQLIFTQQEAVSIREVWHLMLAKLQSTNSVVNETIELLREQNLIADIVSLVEELWTSIKRVIKVAAKVLIQGAGIFIEGANYPNLPPANKS